MIARQMLFLLHRSLGHLTGLLASLGVATAIDFNHTITLGSVLIAFIIIAIAGVFTVRSKIASIWREEAEGERAAKDRLEEMLAKERAERAHIEREQQELRHDLKGEIATYRSQLKVMEAKTDLTAALESIHMMNAAAQGRDERTHDLLIEIRDKLPDEPVTVRAVRKGDT